MLSDIQRNSLAAGAQETAALIDAQQGRGVSLAGAGEAKNISIPASGRAKGAQRAEEGSLPVRDSLAAEAQDSAPLTAAAQQGLVGMLLATVKDTVTTPADAMLGSSGQGGLPAAIPFGSAVQATAGEAAEIAGAGPAPAGDGLVPVGAGSQPATGAAMTASGLNAAAGAVQERAAKEALWNGATLKEAAAQPKQTLAATPAPEERGALLASGGPGNLAAAAGGTISAPKQELAGQVPNAANGRAVESVVVVNQGAGTGGAALDQLRAAQEAVTDGLQKAAAKGEAVRPTAAGAPEKEPRAAVASSGNQGDAVAALSAPASTEEQAATVAAGAADSQPQPDRFAQAESKGPRATLGFHGTYSAPRGVTEATGSKPEASVEDAGMKTAPLAGAGKFVPFQGSAGQGNLGDAGQNGHPGQKAQTGDSAVPTQVAGLPTAAVSEAPQPEAKPAGLKGALHESILAQVRDGVVTHDSKGNGQMTIRLNPGELGELKIQVRMDDNRLRVEVQADNRMVKDLLMSNLDSLKDSLSAKNFAMEGFDVSTGGGFNSPLPEQKENPRQQAFLRSARAGAYPDQGEETRVNYLTGEVNNLLDVRF
jgi:flagellar hook-length control protein FliK